MVLVWEVSMGDRAAEVSLIPAQLKGAAQSQVEWGRAVQSNGTVWN